MNITAEFIISAASARDFPNDDLSEVALVGRSNVGKSSLINALTRQRVARTSAAPGKTRLGNIYRVDHGRGPLYLVDLPGYGYARRSRQGARSDDNAPDFETLARAYFARERHAGLLLVDSRHPGLDSDVAAWEWLQGAPGDTAVVATKIDKLARGERIRAMREIESVFETSVLPVSAVTGEGLDELWKLIDRLANNRNSRNRGSSRPSPPHEGTALPRPRPRARPNRAAARSTRR